MARVAKTTTKDIESFEHRDARRKNMPTAELETLVSEGKQAPKTIRYKRNIDLDPQLASRQGRAGHRRPDGRRRADLHPREDPAGDAHSGPRAPILTGSPNPAPSASCASRLAQIVAERRMPCYRRLSSRSAWIATRSRFLNSPRLIACAPMSDSRHCATHCSPSFERRTRIDSTANISSFLRRRDKRPIRGSMNAALTQQHYQRSTTSRSFDALSLIRPISRRCRNAFSP